MKVAACPRCRGKMLSVVEVTDNIGASDWGAVVIDGEYIVPPSAFVFEAGSITRVELHCGSCRHVWRSRRSVQW